MFDASTQKMTIVTGSLVQAKADNPAASSFHYGTSMAFLTSLKDVIQALLYYYSFEWRS